MEALLVAEDGGVSWADPQGLQSSTRRRTLSGTHAGGGGASTMRSAAGGTLHDAMIAVLRQAPDGRLTAGQLAEEINRRGLYRMRDGRPVAPAQIHARARNYGHLFATGDGLVGLRR